MALDNTGISGRREFPATSWSMIRHAQDPSSPEYERHLRRLVELYWRPVFLVIRKAWSRPTDEARDLTQEFFAQVVLDRGLVRSFAPERGSFRSLIRAAIKRFMLNVTRDSKRQKRGGGSEIVSIDDATVHEADGPLGDAGRLSPEELFDAAWNRAVISEALGRLEARLVASGDALALGAFKRYDVEGDREELTYEDAARGFGVSVPQFKRALFYARELFREAVTELVREYVDGPEELDRELRAFFGL